MRSETGIPNQPCALLINCPKHLLTGLAGTLAREALKIVLFARRIGMAKTKLLNEIPNDVNSQKVKLTGSKKQAISKLEKIFLIETPVDENS